MSHQSIQQLKEQLSAASVTRHAWGPKRAGSRIENEMAAASIKADSAYTALYKTVIDTDMEEWRAVLQVHSYVKHFWDGNSFPYVVEGVRLFHKDRRKELWRELERLNKEMKERAERLDERKPQIIEWAKSKFPETFDLSVYPATWTAEFGVTIREHSIEPPSYLEKDDSEEYKRELQRSLQDIDSSMRRFEQQCLARMSEVSKNLATNLGKETNGGISKNLQGFRELFDRVHQMRFEGTMAFKKAMKEAQEILDDVEPDEIKRPGGVRAGLKEKMERLIAKHKLDSEKIMKKGAGS